MAQKYALVVGCIYPNYYENRLNGCINDAKSIRDILIKRFGFKETNVELLTDANKAAGTDQNKPTAGNIKAILNKFFSCAKFGDVVFFSFSGHGTRIPEYMSSSGKAEQAIVTCDLNIITSMDFREILHGALDASTAVTRMLMLCDACSLISNEADVFLRINCPPNIL